MGLGGRAGWSPGLVHVRVCDNCMTAEAMGLGCQHVDVPLWGGASVQRPPPGMCPPPSLLLNGTYVTEEGLWLSRCAA